MGFWVVLFQKCRQDLLPDRAGGAGRLLGCGKTMLARESCEDLRVLIANRAYEIYGERGYMGGSALDDWLNAEREILSQTQPA